MWRADTTPPIVRGVVRAVAEIGTMVSSLVICGEAEAAF
jgi:hypothetical protein